MAITDICRDRSLTHPALRRKNDAILAEIRPLLPLGWELAVFETHRTPERQRWLYDTGKSKIKNATGKHCQTPSHAEDLVWKYNGLWTWQDPILKNGRRGWQQLEICKRNHGLRILTWDKPHCELKREDA